MGINVKRQDVVDNVHLLAAKLGLGITETIDQVVGEKLVAIEAARNADIAQRLKAIRKIQERLRPASPDGLTSNYDDLYDEDGLSAWLW